MYKILSFDEMTNLSKKLAHYVTPNTTLALIGDLGTGKTTFTQTMARELGIKENIKSPTFNYVLEYLSGKMPLYHFDVYRLGDPMEIYEIGYEDYLNNNGLCIIEWANIIETELPKTYIKIEISYNDENSRGVDLSYVGDTKKEEEMLRYVGFRD